MHARTVLACDVTAELLAGAGEHGVEFLKVCQQAPDAVVLIVEEMGRGVVGTWLLLPTWHAHGCWIDPERRGDARVARKLLKLLGQFGAERNVKMFTTGALDEPTADIIQRLGGVPLPGTHWALPVPPCR